MWCPGSIPVSANSKAHWAAQPCITAPPATGSFGARPAPPAYSTTTVSTSPIRSGRLRVYWRNSARGKGVSNFGDIAQGDDLNLGEFATTGFAGMRRGFAGANDLVNWVNVSLTATGDTVVQFDKSGSGNFTQTAVTLKNDSLFADFGFIDHSSIGAQQVVRDMYSTGHLVLSHTH